MCNKLTLLKENRGHQKNSHSYNTSKSLALAFEGTSVTDCKIFVLFKIVFGKQEWNIQVYDC